MKRAVIVTRLDLYANAVKPRHLQVLLESRGFAVDTLDTVGLGRRSPKGVGRIVPELSSLTVRLFALEMMRELVRVSFRRPGGRLRPWLNGLLLGPVLRWRGAVLGSRLRDAGYDVVICESGIDEGLFLSERVADLQVLDLPAPYADEIYYGGRILIGQLQQLRALESICYSEADAVSFHWHTYEEYVRATFYNGSNVLSCSYGVVPKALTAEFRPREPKIIFLGSLDGYWVNVSLLAELCAIYPSIDIWGGPEPGPELRPFYRGYAPSLDVMANYQFGLITISDDPLRRSSFSSKHLEYASYGLPVLTPAWRDDEVLASSTIPYTAATFLDTIGMYSSEDAWRAKSCASLALAQSLSWDAVFSQLTELLRTVE